MDMREKLIELIEQKYYCSIEEFADHLIANGVEIPVRCKECEYYKQNPWSKEENMMCMCWCDWLATDPDDFCSNGERRNNG